MVNWHDLEHRVITSLARSEEAPNVPGFKHDANARAMAERWAESGKASAPLRDALAAVRGAEVRLRKARLAGLTGSDLQTVREQEAKRLLQRLQKQRADRLRKVYDQISTVMRKHAEERDADPPRSLLALERSKLRFSDYGVQEAVGRLKVLREKASYDESEVDVLASRGRKARAVADDLRRDFPPALASEHGAALLAEAERLVSLPTGTVE